MAPLPKFARLLLSFFSVMYAMNEHSVAPQPGISPWKKPRIEPRRIDAQLSFRSCLLGMMRPTLIGSPSA